MIIYILNKTIALNFKADLKRDLRELIFFYFKY
jgi:hypothetical protein